MNVTVVEVKEKEELVVEKSSTGPVNGAESINGDHAKSQQHRKQKQVGGMTIGAEEVSDLAEGLNDLGLSKTAAASAISRDHSISSPEKNEHDPGSDADPGATSLDPGANATTPKNEKHKTDPIHMFGVLVPQALRQAQGSFVKVVAENVPRLVELDAEMRELEIEIRRTRKMLAKQV